jgi:hypothetical protein
MAANYWVCEGDKPGDDDQNFVKDVGKPIKKWLRM